jgi:hypothetical protein
MVLERTEFRRADRGSPKGWALRGQVPALTFLTIENYVDIEELFWQRDYHDYVHEGVPCRFKCPIKDALLYCYKVIGKEICKGELQDQILSLKWKWSNQDEKRRLQP